MFHNVQTAKRIAFFCRNTHSSPLGFFIYFVVLFCVGGREILLSLKIVHGAFAMQQSVSLSVEIPEELHHSVQHYLDIHSGWSQDRLFCAAISLFLMQNGVTKRQVSRIYLDSLFGQQSETNKEMLPSNA